MLPALAQWEKQAPFPTAETLNDVHIIAPGQAIAVGDGGVILKTMDSGVTWQPLPSGTTANLRGLYFIDDFRGWAVGDEVLLTTNAGRTWQKGVRSGNLSTLNDIDMINAAQGFACGEGVLMQTGDGGHTWSPVPIPSTHSWNALKFFSLTEGFVAGGLGSILYTNDAGQNWAWVPTGTTRWLKSMQFLSRNVAYAAGGDAVLKTTDGGVTWNLQQIPRPTSVVGLFFRNPLLGWLAGENQAILRTQNGGQSCQVQNGGATGDSYNKYPLNRVAFWNENTGVAVGHTGNV
ncbi:MAG TPA: YCF48-related protein, partial [Fimbriimonadaceae bacterium]|nr:YCF48-related protein [Fimbriimonadaceae bacterium]